MIIGVTGLIGSGKSEVTSVFEKLGALHIDADAIGREVVDSDPVVLYRLIMTFGNSIIRKNHTLNRRSLGQLAFSSRDNTELLNAIIHPGLLRRLDSRIAEARHHGRDAVVDAALLIYWNYHRKMDATIIVTATTTNRLARLTAAGLTPDEIRQRTKSQLSGAYLRARSDYIISNNGDRDSLHVKAAKLYHELIKRG